MSNCGKCSDEKYIFQTCCSGIDCGCRGMPVQMINCVECNPKGDAPLPDDEDFKFYAEHVEYIKQEARQ